VEAQIQSPFPWLTIWVKPRQTIRRIIESDPKHQVVILAMLAGVSRALDRAASRNAGDALSLPVILAICVVAGPIGGLPSLYIAGALLRWTGSWLGGKASSEEVRAAIAWSSVPMICTLPLWIPKLVLYRNELFQSSMPRVQAIPLLALPLLGFVAIEITVTIWAFVVLLKCLGEVHGFSAWRALVALTLAFLIVFVPVFLLAVLFTGLTISP